MNEKSQKISLNKLCGDNFGRVVLLQKPCETLVQKSWDFLPETIDEPPMHPFTAIELSISPKLWEEL